VKRQMDVLDRHLADHRFMAGSEYSVADMAIWPWYGKLTIDQSYTRATEFLEGRNYRNVLRWTEEVAGRPAVKRGIMVNRISGDLAGQLHERHDASDFATRTADKLATT
jgi:GSH-dependent disulfide-bond oxidoreductase